MTLKLEKAFEDAHEQGAKEFGGTWLRANERAIEAALFVRANYASPQIKTLLSLVVLMTLRVARERAK